MTRNRNFSVDDLTFRRLKAYAAFQGVKIGQAIIILLDTQDIPGVRPGPGYTEWLVEMLKIGKEQGDEAAMKYLKEHPYVEKDVG